MMAFTGGAQGPTRKAYLKRATLSRTVEGRRLAAGNERLILVHILILRRCASLQPWPVQRQRMAH